MRLLGRKISFKRIPSHVGEVLKMLPSSLQFRRPVELWGAYFARRQPDGNHVDFRDGCRAWLSSNPHDIISLVINFCRREYGAVPEGATVIDIGANIGMYSLHACRSGAAELIAVEPVPEAADILSRNVLPYQDRTRIRIVAKAAAARGRGAVQVPHASSPYARMIEADSPGKEHMVMVETVTLDQLIECCASKRVTILKIDCEGAEWEVLADCSDQALSRIDSIRMELHSKDGRDNETLLGRLRESGFSVTSRNHMIYWLDRDA